MNHTHTDKHSALQRNQLNKTLSERSGGCEDILFLRFNFSNSQRAKNTHREKVKEKVS